MTTRLGRNPYLRVLPNFLEGEEPFLVEDIDSRDTFQLDNSTFLDLLDQADPWTPRSQLEDYLMETYDASPAATDAILENAIDKRILVAETSARRLVSQLAVSGPKPTGKTHSTSCGSSGTIPRWTTGTTKKPSR